jgi:hypothetical protein
MSTNILPSESVSQVAVTTIEDSPDEEFESSSKSTASIVRTKFAKGNNNKIHCIECSKDYSIGSSTTTLKHHLERKHPKIYNSLFPKSVIKGPLDFFIQRQLVDFNDAQKKSIVEFIVNTYQSFNVVECPAFKRFIHSIDAKLGIPCRKTIKKWITHFYTKGAEILKQKLISINYVSVTSDIWTSESNDSYSSLTLHFINDSWENISLLLNCSVIPTPHDAPMIYDWLLENIASWDLLEKVVAITTDTAANGVAAVEMLNNQLKKRTHRDLLHIRCVAHILNLVVQAGLDEVKHLLVNLRTVCTLLKNSPKQWNIFLSFSNSDEKVLKLKIDTPTRWGSTLHMLDRAVLNQKLVDKWLISSKSDKNLKSIAGITFSEDDWTTMSAICELIRPFDLATVDLSGSSYPTLSTVRPLLGHLMKHCHKFIIPVSFEDKLSLIRAKDAMIAKFVENTEKWTTNLDFAALLDPYTKDIAFKDNISIFDMPMFKERDDVIKSFILDWKLHFKEEKVSLQVNAAKEVSRKRKSLMDEIVTNHTADSNNLCGENIIKDWIGSNIVFNFGDDRRSELCKYWKRIEGIF